MSRYNHIVHGLAAWTTLALLCSANSANAQFGEPAQTTQLQLPGSPVSWINSPPLSTELLKGKAAIFYMFEEG